MKALAHRINIWRRNINIRNFFGNKNKKNPFCVAYKKKERSDFFGVYFSNVSASDVRWFACLSTIQTSLHKTLPLTKSVKTANTYYPFCATIFFPFSQFCAVLLWHTNPVAESEFENRVNISRSILIVV